MRTALVVAALVLASACSTTQNAPETDQAAVTVPAAETDSASTTGTQVAVLAGGCFWGVEGVFEHVAGVTDVVSGYAGGAATTANYDAVGTGSTGHAEVVRVTFDPTRISYARILQVFFAVAHDPTELNRQGPDVGTQYRSAIFPTDADQERVAQAYVDQLDREQVFSGPVVTTVETGQQFYPAEEYHQDFMAKHPDHGYIVRFDAPKLVALRTTFPELATDS